MSRSNNVPNPPPLPTQAAIESKAAINAELSKPNNISFDECLWALEYLELQKACYLARVCPIEPPIKCQFWNIKEQLQIGPTCGLTALSMLMGGNPTAEILLTVAKELQYTNNGEMFSANYLHQLISKYFKTTFDQNGNICEIYKGKLYSDEICKRLQENACIFVPYPF